MTCLQSPSSRPTSETSSPLDLVSGLTARFQAASIQPLAPDCAIIPISTILRVGAPTLLPSLVEVGLVSSFTERVSSGIGNDCDEVQLAQPGESNSEEQFFLREKGNDESGFVSGTGLLDELIQGTDAPSVSLLSGSDYFFPSTFMNVDT